ncbi:two-component system sensor histidine kinase RcsC [Edwardsiella piscicida]|uniref:two-component system sensor histidine kinase RcsC n=1 Tax=Edwardsiella piscicida TaxID=1263550 RepID=UPI0002C05DB3|nr:two-component system sensor histidine kinase RcsC [Edwardsiella piscicida]AGH74326.1 hybrid sensory kinase in two-component regulatory system with RcsB and YojN [Edwardsiella piscicida C07-087]EKS7780758.1 two-component system sensor histidine kinase RcsC [Edwardsiella piscicida]EKS7784769.1 two-component system sensor histidine kinase RcsC [Edwardsiella piscicida]UCQ23362.1 two-component system sensor histidine kinase RcsC [Edwardsiella piscicida]UCQ33568.1 two-component system sensor hist
MKYFVSFRTTLKVSRYLFRTLALMLWILGALLTTFYILNKFHEKESDIRQDFNLNFDQAQAVIRHANATMRDIRYIAENRLAWSGSDSSIQPYSGRALDISGELPPLLPIFPESDCRRISEGYRTSLRALSGFIRYWKENFVAAYDLNRIFVIGGSSQCLADFSIRNVPLDGGNTLRLLQQRVMRFQGSNDKDQSLFWVIPGAQSDAGSLYIASPIYSGNQLEAVLGTEQTLRLEELTNPSMLPIGVTLLSDSGDTLLSYAENGGPLPILSGLPDDENYFGYNSSYDTLLLKKKLQPSGLSIVYSLPSRVLLERFNLLLINAIVLNLISGIVLFVLTWLFERKMFRPAENNALRLEEHEQFNRKIVASAPVGISILRARDGSNILSNELAHNYISQFTPEDRQRITRIICEEPVSVLDVITVQNQNLQISFVRSRYRNEDVAICAMVDVSARVKMEESLQEMAAAAEQASQSKSMFLATVSHELRTPLYGIIGNLDLLRTKTLPEEVQRLLGAMSNSSGLLLKIINDILDFSKIESEQLKIEPGRFVPREVIPHIIGNYLPLVVRKRLTLYCFIEPDVPEALSGDIMRIQQVLSNLLSNAIKFTDTGCIILQARVNDFYLEFRVRDTGLGIPPRDVLRLFDPFFQVGSGVQRHFHGTGLGLAICEKLVSLMDGDIAVESSPGLGSIFTIRLPMYQAKAAQPLQPALQQRTLWLDIHNARLERYLQTLLSAAGARVCLCPPLTPSTAQDVLICDHPPQTGQAFAAQVRLCADYLGHARRHASGEWLLNTAAPLELLQVLNRIFAPESVVECSQDSASAAPADRQQDFSDIAVLIVDDHPINRRLLADQLISLGFSQVAVACDGVDALGALQQQAADIVLTDVNMPNMDGYQLTERLRQQGRTLPIVGVTANALAEERQRCIEVGMDSCLSKPVMREDLLASLSGYALQIRRRRENEA